SGWRSSRACLAARVSRARPASMPSSFSSRPGRASRGARSANPEGGVMPEVRAALRGSRLAAVLVGVAVLLATQLALSTVGRLRGGTRELRWLRARLAEGGDHLDRQRRENAELIGAVDRLVHVTEVLHDRAAEARRSVQMEESREPLGEPLVQPVSLAAGAVFVSDDAARAIGELAWVGGQLAAAGDSLAILTALEKQRSEDVAIGSPSLWP